MLSISTAWYYVKLSKICRTSFHILYTYRWAYKIMNGTNFHNITLITHERILSGADSLWRIEVKLIHHIHEFRLNNVRFNLGDLRLQIFAHNMSYFLWPQEIFFTSSVLWSSLYVLFAEYEIIVFYFHQISRYLVLF